jgi:uncharacterized protein (DUF302 family)
MVYYSCKLKLPFEEVIGKVTQSLLRQGFGIVTDIDVQNALLKSLNIGFRRYRVLGACNPKFSYEAINLEAHAGILLPCIVVIQEHENGEVEISALNPLEIVAMRDENDEMRLLSKEVGIRLRCAIDFIHRERSLYADVISNEGSRNFRHFIPG